MPRYSLSLCGLEVTFRTDAEADRIEAAKALLEERVNSLSKSGGSISKDKLLACVALGLADDFLESEAARRQMEDRIGELLER
ncbi:cell division protein ZapA [Paucidesulfovibrio gracilis DSM 16080]|uniref:Cell division protein ZapA n=1 Tax=Paucidesulfovibrio gracilis DSM 16080 TaxID=1121449 RepID=A0A1T4XJD3_9BACT|nr:cell division protein ZapA [Paucidesulfovibrio gracilis]SKA89682.1 cell division protein ZapA [Paucidesulfovibrio gracilis DSM 16080]